ncbi:MAG: GFA family protein [Pseudomonadota bacterium]
MSTVTGRCLCGAVTLSFEPAGDLTACHCDICRRWTGAMFLEVPVKPGTMRYDGPVKTYASSDWAERAWCDRCGTTLWFHLTLDGTDDYAVAAGALDDQSSLKLSREDFYDRKPEGYAFAGDHRKVTAAENTAAFEKHFGGLLP